MHALDVLFAWLPQLLQGFVFNLLIGLLAMLLGTAGGLVLGAAQLAPQALLQWPARLLTQLMRNSPWLVSLFYVMYLLPFDVQIGGRFVDIPDWLKATIGLSIPAMGNMAEIVRGGLRSIPVTQWEAAAALGYGPVALLRRVIVPQAARRMLPPWMNLYCIVTLSTVLASIVGVTELMSVSRDLLASETDPALLLPVYALTMVLFFIYIYPFSLWTKRLERRWAKGN